VLQLTSDELLEYAKMTGGRPYFFLDIGIGQKVWNTAAEWSDYEEILNVTVENGRITLTNSALDGYIILNDVACDDMGTYLKAFLNCIPEWSVDDNSIFKLYYATSPDDVTWSAWTEITGTAGISDATETTYTKFKILILANDAYAYVDKLTFDFHFNIDVSSRIFAMGELTQNIIDNTLSGFNNSNIQVSLEMDRAEIPPLQAIINNPGYQIFCNLYAGFIDNQDHLIFKGIVKDMSIKDSIDKTVVSFNLVDFTDSLRNIECDESVKSGDDYFPADITVREIIRRMLNSQNIYDMSLIENIDGGISNFSVCPDSDDGYEVKYVFKINKNIYYQLRHYTSMGGWKLCRFQYDDFDETGLFISESIPVPEMNGVTTEPLIIRNMFFNPEELARFTGISQIAFFIYWYDTGHKLLTVNFNFDGSFAYKKGYTMARSSGTALWSANAFRDILLLPVSVMRTSMIFNVVADDCYLTYTTPYVAGHFFHANRQGDGTEITFDKYYTRPATPPLDEKTFMSTGDRYHPNNFEPFSRFRAYYSQNTFTDGSHGRVDIRKLEYVASTNVWTDVIVKTLTFAYPVQGEISRVYHTGPDVMIVLWLWSYSSFNTAYSYIFKIEPDFLLIENISHNFSATPHDKGNYFNTPAESDGVAPYFYVSRLDTPTKIKKITPAGVESEYYETGFSNSLVQLGQMVDETETMTPVITSDASNFHEYRKGSYQISNTNVFEGKTIWEVLTSLALAFNFYVGATGGKIFFRATAGGMFFEINDDNIMEINDAKIDLSKIKNVLTVKYLGGAEKIYRNEDSIIKYGEKPADIDVQFISEEDADALAVKFFERYALAFYTVDLSMKYSPHIEIIDNGKFDFPDVAFGAFSWILSLKHSLIEFKISMSIRMNESIDHSWYGISMFGIAKYG
jgi:hypothetical protein